MDYSQYEPPIVDGIINYGEMHAKRKQDAMKAFTSSHVPESEKVLTILCRKGHRLAWVEYTPEPVVVCFRSNKVDSALQDLRRETDNKGIEYIAQPYFDYLNAGNDLDLEVMCYCGGTKVLSRQQLQGAIARGKRSIIV